MVQIPENMKELINVEEENDAALVGPLKQLANKENAVLILLAAPYKGVKTSPGSEEYAQIGLAEEFGIEEVIKRVRDKLGIAKKIHLVLNSPGGLISSSYKVSKILRDSYENIKVFVPHIAKSGGTLVALSADEIVMGPMSELGPLDVQIVYQGEWVSALSAFRIWNALEKQLKDKSENEIPLHWKMLADKIDPMLLGSYEGVLYCMQNYAVEILSSGMLKSDSTLAQTIASNLVWGYQDHREVINFKKAQTLGLKVKWYEDYKEEWEIIRQWLSNYLLKSSRVHFIRYILPESKPPILEKSVNPISKDQ